MEQKDKEQGAQLNISMKNYLRMGLLTIAIVFVITMFYYSGLETKSYNSEESYNTSITVNTYIEGRRQVLITENANNNGSIVAFGIIAAASLLGIAILSTKDPE